MQVVSDVGTLLLCYRRHCSPAQLLDIVISLYPLHFILFDLWSLYLFYAP